MFRSVTSSLTQQEEVTLSMTLKLSEVIKTQTSELEHVHEPRIYKVKICQEGNGGYSFSVKHSGDFRLQDYEELDLEVTSARLVRRK